jgi:hypothetical protein
MKVADVVLAIVFKQLSDDDLTIIEDAIRGRRGVVAPVQAKAPSIYTFSVGDRVRFNQRANPKYLIGTEATVTGHKRTKITIKLDAAAGRFGGHGNITCPLSIIEKV